MEFVCYPVLFSSLCLINEETKHRQELLHNKTELDKMRLTGGFKLMGALQTSFYGQLVNGKQL